MGEDSPSLMHAQDGVCDEGDPQIRVADVSPPLGLQGVALEQFLDELLEHGTWA